jgi:FkbM family methyltransferase
MKKDHDQFKNTLKEYELFLNSELRVDREMIVESIRNYIVDFISYENKICLDLGANLGAFSKIAIDYGASKVIAVECDSRNYTKLNHNFRDIDNVEIIHGAISNLNQSTIKIFKSNSKSNHSSTSILKRNNRFNEYDEVVNIDFKTLVKSTKPDIIKIDIEGAEHALIDDIIETLPDVLFIELHGNYDKCAENLGKLSQAYPNTVINEIIVFGGVGGYDCIYYK